MNRQPDLFRRDERETCFKAPKEADVKNDRQKPSELQ